MTLLDTATKPPATTARQATSLVLRLVFSGQTLCLPPLILRVPPNGLGIGRETAPELHGDGRLSRHHAAIRADAEGGLIIGDEHSKNGTWVNASRVQGSKLQIGDVISVGDSCLVVGHEPGTRAGLPLATLAGDSAAMRAAREAILRLGPSHSTVLLMAETGCGKEVAARALHAASALNGEFVAVNCAAVPENLFEAQFFGHRAGAFTGAAAHDGFFRTAAGGTLFLDEIGELPLSQQPKLLRAIQERAVVPLGARSPVPCDVRIVAATNRNLAQEVVRGGFRADLLARLFESQISLPALRERREDILELFARGFEGGLPLMPHSLAEALLLHAWPYNVRELLATARELADDWRRGSNLDVTGFQRRLRAFDRAPSTAPGDTRPGRSKTPPLDPLELTRALAKNDGSVARVAREVGRSRRQIYRWIEKHGIDVTLFRRSD